VRKFIVVLYGLTALLHLLFVLVVDGAALALLGPLAMRGSLIMAASVAIPFSLAAAFRWRFELLRNDRHVSAARRVFEELYFVHWMALIFALLLAVPGALAVAWWFPQLEGLAFARQLALLSYAGGLLIAAWGVVVRRRWVRVVTIDVPIAGLPAAFDGYLLAQMSDLHVGSFCPRERVEAWVRRVNGLGADAIVLTGDYVTSGTRFHADIAATLSELSAPDGVFAVMGNHDYFGDGEPLMGLLREGGVRLLRNEHTIIERDTAKLCLAGVDDIYTKRIDIDRALEGRDAALPLVVLAHDPRSFPKLAREGADLVLSGHTHWGQLAVPFLASRYNYASTLTRFHAGLVREGAAQLYISPGLGTTGPPVRVGTWPEISLLRLRPASARA
jgi:predicted MPP superfamily phosphohydrolase